MSGALAYNPQGPKFHPCRFKNKVWQCTLLILSLGRWRKGDQDQEFDASLNYIAQYVQVCPGYMRVYLKKEEEKEIKPLLKNISYNPFHHVNVNFIIVPFL